VTRTRDELRGVPVGEMTPAEQALVINDAVYWLVRELNANADRIVRILRDVDTASLAASSSATVEPNRTQGDVAGTQSLAPSGDSRKDDLSTSEEGAT
jgi:hypothetical protein